MAVGQIKTQGSVTLTATPFNPPFTPIPFATWSGAASTLAAGFVVGGGEEFVIFDHLTLKGEYLWYDLGNLAGHDLNCTPTLGVPCGPPFYPTPGRTSSAASFALG